MIPLTSRIAAHFRPPIIGYEHPDLVDWIITKTKAYNPTQGWTALGSTVLDFGGGAGVHYKEGGDGVARWAVVETSTMVEACKAQGLETANLKFFDYIADAKRWLGGVDTLYCNGALHYTYDPLSKLNLLLGIAKPKHKLFKRTAFGSRTYTQTSYLSSNGPGTLLAPRERLVRYPVTEIPYDQFCEINGGPP